MCIVYILSFVVEGTGVRGEDTKIECNDSFDLLFASVRI